jgi:hypothetical protein
MKSLVITILTIFFLFFSGCNDSKVAIEKTETTPGLQSESLFVLKNETWGTESTIDVCWEASFDHARFSEEMTLVYWTVKSTWERYSSFKTRGWGICEGQEGYADVRINIEDSEASAPHTKGLGRQLRGLHNGMVLNFSFERWGTGWPKYAGSRTAAIQRIAMHEFGHMLGFAHEHNRQEGREKCAFSPQGENGTATVGFYDSESVMNYCSPQISLSSGDTTGLFRYYGKNADLYLWTPFHQRLSKVWKSDRGAVPLSPWFDPEYYLQNNPDLLKAGIGSVEGLIHHYSTWGIGEGRQASIFFDPKFYLQKNQDVARLFGPANYPGAAMHFQIFGLNEGRAGSAQFDPKVYLLRYPDVAQVYGVKNYFEAVVHFANEGNKENRSGAP